ncbi:Osmoprotectant ABC transporter ATP-binding subunit YehX [Collimonas arenae]|uniref:Osmoprotectant ABC transporter ATP-binding subunit YehX n=1 Tax=Collimonas arenae TaxID=279058 RepID=A0A0A1FAQ4_9BURK|nr:ABC transporter ATP-binding protein [Collimonas arenae]AIY41621.1 Osmoprotectant ABC transporter ATP-binding subunit YehX [Collimonas arenae]
MIEIDNICKSFDGRAAVSEMSLTIKAGELIVLIGSSGSGKSTFLKLLNRLLEPDSGNIQLHGKDIADYSPEQLRRRIGYAIQSVGLFPHWTVEQNIAAVPTLLKWPKARIRERVSELLSLLHLPPEVFLQRYPHQLSGGQQQRVGVARALAADPEVLLMDEPFGALDPVTRASLQQELASIHAMSGKTIVLVTHDIDEALALGERIVLMDQGRIAQQGTPRDFLLAPASDFVRGFVGQSDVGIRLLGLDKVADRVRAGDTIAGEPIRSNDTLREALSAFITRKVDILPVVDEHGQSAGVLHFSDLLGAPT